ncbi:MAG: hypothetical protein ACLTSX_02780 [Collinsella sp.]
MPGMIAGAGHGGADRPEAEEQGFAWIGKLTSMVFTPDARRTSR